MSHAADTYADMIEQLNVAARKDADWLSTDERQGKGHFVICDYTRGGCGASTGWKRTKKEIVATWNTRTAASEV